MPGVVVGGDGAGDVFETGKISMQGVLEKIWVTVSLFYHTTGM